MQDPSAQYVVLITNLVRFRVLKKLSAVAFEYGPFLDCSARRFRKIYQVGFTINDAKMVSAGSQVTIAAVPMRDRYVEYLDD